MNLFSFHRFTVYDALGRRFSSPARPTYSLPLLLQQRELELERGAHTYRMPIFLRRNEPQFSCSLYSLLIKAISEPAGDSDVRYRAIGVQYRRKFYLSLDLGAPRLLCVPRNGTR